MEQVDFDYVGRNEFTIYRASFEKYIKSRFKLDQKTKIRMERPKSEWFKVVIETEAVFDFLVKQGIQNGYDVDAILEIPDSTGWTCFSIASDCSENISNYIISRRINVNSIDTIMRVPDFKYPSLSVQMMENGINPYVIRYDGDSQVDKYPSSFENEEEKRLLVTFSRSVHYSIEDILCKESCPTDCNSRFKRFYCNDGPLVEMTDQNQIGSGGFSMVFKELFFGEPMAMKCMLMGKIKNRTWTFQAVSDLEKNISEYRSQIATVGSGVIVPIACVRQQNQEKDNNGKWTANNYNIYIYPLYDCNLDELHGKYFDKFTEEIIADIIHQCFIRIGSDQNV